MLMLDWRVCPCYWVECFCVLKRFNEAKEWLQKAVEGDGKSPVVIEHYGDVLYQLNQKKEALEYWKKAKNTGGDSELLNKKVSEGVLYE